MIEIKLHDYSKLEFVWVHPDLLAINRWVPGSEFSTSEWRLTGSVLLAGNDLAQFLAVLHHEPEPELGLPAAA